ncbi:MULTISPECIES: squalene synthase HpnC [Methylobacterium]|uniref:Hydroxysqualene synthase n=1 Tax=Methylobacterium jeotgali TaxID=381630 RepID=A0ABQ4SQM4_9HYPH|nr:MULTISPECIES: squalene synthase HpnC [Methylobacterium]PIU06456.1 MAG: squalene synthase HpnC [Methylobacterium sp. CG09_land_8_20_14_0_10_71_15]PIU14289.1 MAG: squalene synthase HpnC [Methylobacterium sp. CG08_land_8_20_14_0_20_71_15]GBU16665.1 squalene synthase HpnC [Methylobacterium sp.]GJE05397.1 Hydroxysqualene synthase [Methylobacterium jeotgali]
MSAGLQTATDARTGKGQHDENFPVASHLIHPRNRGAILAFYNYVRAGDDVADHAGLSPERKIEMLDALADALTGKGGTDPSVEPLRRELDARGLPPTHALELLDAFRMDARKSRYADWDELIHYCRYSAMPVGRFVLDVHGEDPSRVWASSDAICAALQVLNHLQDCGKDFRTLDRVYIPAETLARHGATVEMLGAERASPELRAVFRELAERTLALLDDGKGLPGLIDDLRLSLEIAAIHRLAVVLTRGLLERDPLSEKVHHGKAAFALTALGGVLSTLVRRPFRSRAGAAQ